jgi:hypothetical protein
MPRVSSYVSFIVCIALSSYGSVRAQDEQRKAAESPTVKLEVSAADQIAATTGSEYKVHLRPVKSAIGRYSPIPVSLASPEVATAKASVEAVTESDAALASSGSTVPSVPSPGFYPADLTHPFGGSVVVSAESHPVYVDCTASCWGHPANFLSNLFQSSFIHVADQYVGHNTDNRYTVGTAASVSYPILTALSDNDVLQIVHTAASALGTGYHHIYNVFLPQGVDECFVGTTQCYSPDNPSTFVFCAYHGSVTFSDIGHVLFTVEPFQNVPGCGIFQPSPNGGLIDSTSNVLGHETFETITDPDPPNGWIAVNSLGVFGEEIGDLCPGVNLTQPFFEDPVSVINGVRYEVQPMYSNKYHACSFAP